MIRNRPIKLETPPRPEEFGEEEHYRNALRDWSEEWSREEKAFNNALVAVLRFASCQLLSQPAWWLVGPEGSRLNDALDAVMDAMTPEQVALFDKAVEQADA